MLNRSEGQGIDSRQVVDMQAEKADWLPQRLYKLRLTLTDGA